MLVEGSLSSYLEKVDIGLCHTVDLQLYVKSMDMQHSVAVNWMGKSPIYLFSTRYQEQTSNCPRTRLTLEEFQWVSGNLAGYFGANSKCSLLRSGLSDWLSRQAERKEKYKLDVVREAKKVTSRGLR